MGDDGIEWDRMGSNQLQTRFVWPSHLETKNLKIYEYQDLWIFWIAFKWSIDFVAHSQRVTFQVSNFDFASRIARAQLGSLGNHIAIRKWKFPEMGLTPKSSILEWVFPF